MRRLLLVGYVLIVVAFSLALIPVRTQAAATLTTYTPILAYHHIATHVGPYYLAPTVFEQELAYLRTNQFHTVSLEAYMDYLQNGKELPEKTVILTFDDGYDDAYQNALPLLQKYGFTGTFFIITGRLGEPGYLTWEQVDELRRNGMEIGAHTVSHPFLTLIPRDRAFFEIWFSRLALELYLRQPVNIFAYPYNDHNPDIVRFAQIAGFRGASTVSPHKGDISGNIYEIQRVGVLNGESLSTFQLVLSTNVNIRVRPRSKAKP